MTTTACLIGNGLSIAFNRELHIGALTSHLLHRFSIDSHNDLRAVARSVTAQDGGFEDLLGPFDGAAAVLQALPGFQTLIDSSAEHDSLREALQRTHTFVSSTYRAGTSTVLDLVATLARARADAHFDTVVVDLCRALVALGRPSDLTVATLNYDGLIHAGFLDEEPIDPDDSWNLDTRPLALITDLADGYPDAAASHQVVEGQSPIVGRRLRERDTLMQTRLALLQLHGSLAWLRQPHTGLIWKFSIEDLRRCSYWEGWREGTTDWSPVVVLTNQKGPVVDRYPFQLAYEVFRTRLERAGRWLIAGCALGDEPIRQLLRDALATRRRRGRSDPRLLVVGDGTNLATIRESILAVVSLPSVEVASQPLPEALRGQEWQAWASG